MHFALISSKQDRASINIKDNLINNYNFNKNYNLELDDKAINLFTINGSLIHAENLDKKINSDFFIFISKHFSKENTPAFTLHSIGNWYKADFGGREKKLCPASALLLKDMFLELVKNGREDYKVTLEATHHGPYLEKPAIFIEIGSTEKEWSDESNGEIVAKAIMSAIRKFLIYNTNYIPTLLIGGSHYANAGNKIMLRTNYAIGYICPKYMLEYLDEDLLMQAINKTIPKPEIILVDWKGLGQHKQKIVRLLERLNLKYGRVQNILREL